MEQAPQPSPPDLYAEARGYENVDSWLTQIPVERLHYMLEVVGQVDAEAITHEAALAQMLAITLRFSGKDALSVPVITETFKALAIRVALEVHVREGDMTKEGAYSLILEAETAVMALTEQGRAKRELERGQ